MGFSELRDSQKTAALKIYDKLCFDEESKDTKFIGLQAGTGYGKTRTVLEALKLGIKSLRKSSESYPKDPKLTKNTTLYAFVRTRSQVQAFLREAEVLNLNAAVLPSKSLCCYNNVFSDIADNTISEIFQNDTLPFQDNKQNKTECKTVSKSLVPLIKHVNGNCKNCPLSLYFYDNCKDADLQAKFDKYHKQYPRIESFDIVKKFYSILKETKDIEKTLEVFNSEIEYICPYSLVMSSKKFLEIDLMILTYPYLIDNDIRKTSFGTLFDNNIQVAIFDECHNMEYILASANELKLTRENISKSAESILEIIKLSKTSSKNKFLQNQFFKNTEIFVKMYSILHLWDQNWKIFENNYKNLDEKEIHFKSNEFIKIFCDSKKQIQSVIDSCSSAISYLSAMTDVKPDSVVELSSPVVKNVFTTCLRLQSIFNNVLSIVYLLESNSDTQKLYYEIEDNKICKRQLVYHNIVKDIFSNVKNVILLSGTMPSDDFWKNRIGITIDNIEICDKIGSMKIYGVGGVDSMFKNRSEKVYRTYAEIIEEVHKDSKKNTLVGFTSNAFMENTAKYFSTKIDFFLGRPDLAINDIVKEMHDIENGIYCIVAGSKFAEGVEYVKNGKSLIDKVIVCGIPIIPPSLYSKDLQNYYIKYFNISHNDAYINISHEPAFMKIRQMIGRSIRGPNDCCDVYLVDSRFGNVYWKNKFNFDGAMVWES